MVCGKSFPSSEILTVREPVLLDDGSLTPLGSHDIVYVMSCPSHSSGLQET